MRMGQAQEINAEHIAHRVARESLLGRAARHQGAVLDDCHLGGEAGDEMEIMQNGNHRQAEIGDEAEQQAARLWIEMVGRLVEKQELRLLHDGTGDLGPLALAAGERAHLAPRQCGKAAARQRVVDQGQLLASRHGAAMGNAAERDIIAERDAPIRLVGLPDNGDPPRALRGFQGGQRLAEQADGAAARTQHAAKHVQQRRLAGAVRADNGQPLARRDRQRDVAQQAAAKGGAIAEPSADRIAGRDAGVMNASPKLAGSPSSGQAWPVGGADAAEGWSGRDKGTCHPSSVWDAKDETGRHAIARSHGSTLPETPRSVVTSDDGRSPGLRVEGDAGLPGLATSGMFGRTSPHTVAGAATASAPFGLSSPCSLLIPPAWPRETVSCS